MNNERQILINQVLNNDKGRLLMMHLKDILFLESSEISNTNHFIYNEGRKSLWRDIAREIIEEENNNE